MKHNTIIITGTRKGIGEYLASYYLNHGYNVIGCSRSEASIAHLNYMHYCLDVADENEVKKMFLELRKSYVVLTPLKTVQNIINTNFIGTFLFCRETSKLMMKHKYGRIINFSTVAYPLNLEGEAIYTASKAAIESFTKILAKELGQFNITVNSIGPSPIKTDLVKNIQHAKINSLIEMQIIKRFGEFIDISNVIDFYLREESSFITGQTIYLGGISLTSTF